MTSDLDDALAERYQNAATKARRLYPGLVGDVVAEHLLGSWSIRTLLGPGSLTERLLTAIEQQPDTEGAAATEIPRGS